MGHYSKPINTNRKGEEHHMVFLSIMIKEAIAIQNQPAIITLVGLLSQASWVIASIDG